MKHFTQEELKAMTLEKAVAHVENEVYAAARLLEDLRYAGRIRGNGHHARQAIAASAAKEMRERWLPGAKEPKL